MLWAQRSSATESAKNVLYLTVKIADTKNLRVDLQAEHLHLESDSEDYDNHYVLDIDFYKAVKPEESRHWQNGNSVYFVIQKLNAEKEYWPRLTKLKVKYFYIHTDFDKWVDEDDQDEEEGGALGDLPAMDEGNVWESMLQDNPELAKLANSANGQFDFSKLPVDANQEELTSQATEEDFSSSDEEEGEGHDGAGKK